MITTNTGAKKLESSDNWREIFPNSTLGTAGAHNASVDAADRIQPEIAPIINGKQCALGAAKDDYVLLRNSTITGKSDGAYIAAKAIPANTDIDSTYLGNAITGGISNSLNSNITKLQYTTDRTAAAKAQNVTSNLSSGMVATENGYLTITASSGGACAINIEFGYIVLYAPANGFASMPIFKGMRLDLSSTYNHLSSAYFVPYN